MKLKPCPFCGGKAEMFSLKYMANEHFVRCSQCDSSTHGQKTKEEAMEIWNRRYEPPNEPLTLDELRQMDGEPVWTEKFGWQVCYGLENCDGIFSMRTGSNSHIPMQTYGLEWLAYRRRPEEVLK